MTVSFSKQFLLLLVLHLIIDKIAAKNINYFKRSTSYTQVDVPTGSKYNKTVAHPMSRSSQTESDYVQTFMRSPDFNAFMSRLSCVQKSFVCLCSYFRTFIKTFVRCSNLVHSCPDFCAFIPNMRSPKIRALTRFVRSCPDIKDYIACSLFKKFIGSRGFSN